MYQNATNRWEHIDNHSDSNSFCVIANWVIKVININKIGQNYSKDEEEFHTKGKRCHNNKNETMEKIQDITHKDDENIGNRIYNYNNKNKVLEL